MSFTSTHDKCVYRLKPVTGLRANGSELTIFIESSYKQACEIAE